MTGPIRLNLRLTFPRGVPLSHGKAELMELIRETGSIRQAAAKMDMSYRRAWLLVDELNHLFHSDLDDEEVDTVGGFVFNHLGKMPLPGDEVQVDGILVHVLEVQGNRIRKVRVQKHAIEPVNHGGNGM